MATGTLVHSLGSMNLSPMIHEGSKWHLLCRLQPSNVIEIDNYPILPHAFVAVTGLTIII